MLQAKTNRIKRKLPQTENPAATKENSTGISSETAIGNP